MVNYGKLAVTVVITLDIDLTPVRDAIAVAVGVALVLGAIYLIHLAILYGLGAMAAAGAFAIIALLLGDIDDVDEGTS